MLIIGVAGCGASEDSKRTASQSASEQEKALASARYRIDSGGVSKKGLISQLEVAGYSTADATFAANNVGADWKEEAVEQAQGRLGAEEYSKKSLIDHLAEADGFTRAQAEYAVNKVYD